jgi:hypothetical protein
MCEVIRRRGVSDAQAAQMAGISRATLGRWKRDHRNGIRRRVAGPVATTGCGFAAL